MYRKIQSLIVLLAAVIIVFPNPAQAEEMTADEILDKVQEANKLVGAESLSTLTIFNDRGQKRVRKIAMVTKLFDNGDTEKRLMRFLEPADVKGTSFLLFDYEQKDDDIWFYMPALRKTRRIVS